MKKGFAVLFVLIVPILCIVAGGKLSAMYAYKLLPRYIAAPFKEDVSDVITSQGSGAVQKTIKVLFIGNSFTYSNDMPRMLADIASSDPANRVQLVIQSVTKGATHLIKMWQETTAPDVLKSGHWDYVVLQEHSGWTASQQNIDETFSALNQWVFAVTEVGAKPLFFENWSDKEGSRLYTDSHYFLYGQTPDQAQKEFNGYTEALAHSFKIDVVPVGQYWASARSRSNVPDLYSSDSHHPSMAGTYLTALVFYRFFTGNVPDHVTYVPVNMTREQTQALISLFPNPK